MTITYVDEIKFDLSQKDRIAFLDIEDGIGISIPLEIFLNISDIVKEEKEKGKI